MHLSLGFLQISLSCHDPHLHTVRDMYIVSARVLSILL